MTAASYLGALGLRQARPGPRQLGLCLLCPPGFLSRASDTRICLEALIQVQRQTSAAGECAVLPFYKQGACFLSCLPNQKRLEKDTQQCRAGWI